MKKEKKNYKQEKKRKKIFKVNVFEKEERKQQAKTRGGWAWVMGVCTFLWSPNQKP